MTDKSNDSELKKSMTISNQDSTSNSVLNRIKFFESKNATAQTNKQYGSKISLQPPKTDGTEINLLRNTTKGAHIKPKEEDKPKFEVNQLRLSNKLEFKAMLENRMQSPSDTPDPMIKLIPEEDKQINMDIVKENKISISQPQSQQISEPKCELTQTITTQQEPGTKMLVEIEPLVETKPEVKAQTQEIVETEPEIKTKTSIEIQPLIETKLPEPKIDTQPIVETKDRSITEDENTYIPQRERKSAIDSKIKLPLVYEKKMSSIKAEAQAKIETNEPTNISQAETPLQPTPQDESPNIRIFKTDNQIKQLNTQISCCDPFIKIGSPETTTLSSQIENKPSILFNEDVRLNNKAKNILQNSKTFSATNIKSYIEEVEESTKSSISNKQINTTNEEVFLSSVEVPIEVVNESFCEGFFIATAPKDNGKVVENSEGFLSSCGHSVCSDLPAMQPEIIYRYPEKDTKTLELNNLAASICFPTGIKICYEQKDPISVKNYSSPITNQQGDRYYMMTYHFFYKMLNSEFIKIYSMYPLKSQMMKFCDEFLDKIEIDQDSREKIDQQLEVCQELGFRDIVCIPFCICLISKYPYLREMEYCLESMRIQLSNYRSSSEEIIKLVSYLINSIPIPPLNSTLSFGLPHMSQMVELACPKYQDMNFLNKNINCILNVLSIENIIIIFRLMIFEQKILFLDNEYNRLSEITEGFISLLYPFQWIHTYIAIMSDQMMKYLQAFLPFLNGIHEDLFKSAKPILNEADEGVYIVYISKDQIDINSNINGKKIKIKNKM